MFAAIYFRTGNIWMCVTIHALWDFFSFLPAQNTLFADAAGSLTGTVANTSWIPQIVTADVMPATYSDASVTGWSSTMR